MCHTHVQLGLHQRKTKYAVVAKLGARASALCTSGLTALLWRARWARRYIEVLLQGPYAGPCPFATQPARQPVISVLLGRLPRQAHEQQQHTHVNTHNHKNQETTAHACTVRSPTRKLLAVFRQVRKAATECGACRQQLPHITHVHSLQQLQGPGSQHRAGRCGGSASPTHTDTHMAACRNNHTHTPPQGVAAARNKPTQQPKPAGTFPRHNTKTTSNSRGCACVRATSLLRCC